MVWPTCPGLSCRRVAELGEAGKRCPVPVARLPVAGVARLPGWSGCRSARASRLSGVSACPVLAELAGLAGA
jgi:hypothetical protein